MQSISAEVKIIKIFLDSSDIIDLLTSLSYPATFADNFSKLMNIRFKEYSCFHSSYPRREGGIRVFTHNREIPMMALDKPHQATSED